MYAYFKGIIADVEEDALIIDVNNIGYRIYCPDDMLKSHVKGETLTVYTYTCVREDAFILYGFGQKEDLKLFKLLITVSGIGPKMALGILSVMDSSSVISAIISGNSKLLSSAPGIGAKTAGRIILELKDKVNPADMINSLSNIEKDDEVIALRNEAFEALVGLGISSLEASKAINRVEINKDSKIENIIKQLLSII